MSKVRRGHVGTNISGREEAQTPSPKVKAEKAMVAADISNRSKVESNSERWNDPRVS